MSECLLCGRIGDDVTVTIVRFRPGQIGRTFDAVPRCKDHDACRVRVLATGETWPVDDGRAARESVLEALR